MQDLRVSLIQTKISWEDVDQNLQNLEVKLEGIQQNSCDLIVLPEMFSTGFSMNTSLAEDMNGKAVKWLKKWAELKESAIAGSVMIHQDGKFLNRLIVAYPNGHLDFYDKRHLFRMANEHDFYTQGQEKRIIEIKGWKINLLVCYDLRFPVWSRNTFTQKEGKLPTSAYDALLYVANWPKVRVNAWDCLLRARAIENQCYTLAVNRVGSDGNKVEYNGHSQAIDPKGEVMALAREDAEEVLNCSLSFHELELFREKFPVGLDAD